MSMMDGPEYVSAPVPGRRVPGAKPGKRGYWRLITEGPRGSATRLGVWWRYATYLLVIIACSGITEACFSSVSDAHSGGEWMLLSVTFQIVVASIGSWQYAAKRPEITQQLRSFVFGYTVFPGTGVAIFMWAASHISATSTTGTDVFVSTLNNALPWIYFLPIILPTIIFVKSVAGMRSIHREQMDDQETYATYSRNDGSQR